MKKTILFATVFVCASTVAALCAGLGASTNSGTAHFALAAAAGEAEAQGPATIISETIRKEVGRQLRDSGATYDDLQVTVAEQRDSATPFKVSYRGLRNFTPKSGMSPDADGSFIMNYAGAGQWKGDLSGTTLLVQVGKADNIDLPFVNDPEVVGNWESVDFVANPNDFVPGQKSFQGELFLKKLSFLEEGKTPQRWWTWTKGFLMHHGDRTASRYEIRNLAGESYMFLEWKSGDVMIMGMKPHYYVLAKK